MSQESVLPVFSAEIVLEKIAEIAIQIQQDRALEDILRGAIADVRTLLQADRTLIYRLLDDRVQAQDAVAVFESVSPEWASLLGQSLSPACLDAVWLERDQQGHAHIRSNLCGEMCSSGDVEICKQLQVQAYLAVPMFSQGTLWGVLVAHHCRSPRDWQPLEVQLLQHMALQLGIAVQQADWRQRHLNSQQHDEARYPAVCDGAGSAIAITDATTEITENQKADLIHNIAQGVSAMVGEAFFRSLVSYLLRLLDMDQAFVGELIAPDNEQIKIITGLNHDQALDGMDYPLAGTPCKTVVEHGFCIYPDHLQQRFPDDLALQTLGGEGYVGMPLVSSTGTVIGLIGVISNQAIANVEFIQEVLTIFAARASSELERRQAEAVLRRYERIVAATPDCVAMIDRNYRYQVVNQTFLAWQQQSSDHIIGRSVSDLLGQARFETACKPNIDSCLAGSSQQDVEAWITYPDGQRRFTRAAYVPYIEADGTIAGVVINIHDLTELKQAERENQSLRKRLQFVLAASPAVIYSCVPEDDFNFTFISENVTTLFGYSPAEVFATSNFWVERLHPDDVPGLRAGLALLLQQGHHIQEYRFRHSDGHYCWVQDELRLVRNADGKPIELVGCLAIIDDRKQTADQLRNLSDRFYLAVQSAKIGIWDWDVANNYLFWDDRMYELYDIQPSDFNPIYADWESRVHPDDLLACRRVSQQALAGERDYKTDFRIVLPDGSIRHLESHALVQHDSDGQPCRMIGVNFDISDRKRGEAERKAAEMALREQQQLTEQIAASTLAILYIYDLTEQRNIYANQQLEKVLGYSSDEIQAMGETFFPQLMHPEDLPIVMTHQQHLLTIQDDEFVETEYRMRHKNGDYRWLLSRDRIFKRFADGLPKQSLGVAADITILKETQAALHQQVDRQRLLMAIGQHIRQTLDLDQILQTTVTEVRQFLQTDRVIVYRFEPDWSGSVIAESVTAEWNSILNQQIIDTCFAETQGQLYQQGRAQATHDIYTAHLSPCHLALQEQMQVRAKLVVPILQDDHLWGLLVAQHCRAARPWDAVEIELQEQLATQLAIAIQQANLYQQVHTLNTSLELQVQERTAQLQQALNFEALLKRITDRVRDSLDEGQILHAAVAELAHGLSTGACNAGLYNPEQTTSTIAYEFTKTFSPAQGYTMEIATAVDSEAYTSLLDGQICHFCNRYPNPLRDQQLLCILAVPIVDDQGVLGDLWLFKPPQNVFDDQEVRLVQQVANQCAIALRQSRLYQAAQQQVLELERLNQLKDDFLSTVSHELRSPMSNIKLATQLLEISLNHLGLLTDESSPIHRYFKILQEEEDREINLINDLLDLARLDAGTEPLSFAPIDLQSYIPYLAETFVERMEQQQQQLAIHIPDDVPLFTTDLPFFERILSELLHNACKYTPAREQITVSAQSSSATLMIFVSNTGVEIPEAECDRVFNKFYRIPNNDPWRHGGTGLGLALVKKLTERLGGSICLESGHGQTTFILEFETSLSVS